jgi:GntR family transcriptional regulator/MocR family aminotransferase
MTESLIYLDPNSTLNLQAQIRQKLVDAIVQGVYPPGSKLPSSRKLAEQLGVARNTVVLACEQLVEERFIESRERSGLFVNKEVLEGRVGYFGSSSAHAEMDSSWRRRIRLKIQSQPQFQLPAHWQRHPFPFIDGYFDSSLYPTAQWREASRMALGSRVVSDGSVSEGYADDPALIEEIRTKMLPRRGITASADQILITIGEQNALYLLTRLLAGPGVKVAMEDPGNPQVRQLLQQSEADLLYQPVDENGMVITAALQAAQLVYVTPSHQVPTAVTMHRQRRVALLKQASTHDQVIIEDDFEHEHNYLGQPQPALHSMDSDNRVIYVSGLPKMLSPGLRIGYIVAAPELIREARKLRQMVIGRPSLLTQRTAALFLSLGHYDASMARLHRVLGQRWDALRQALNHYYRGEEITLPTSGGTALWVECPSFAKLENLVGEAARRGILIEPDTHFYGGRRQPKNFFRLGVTSIPEEHIREGVRQLSELLREMSGDRTEKLDKKDPTLLSAKQLATLLPGATIHYKTFYGDPCTIELHEDGSMTGRAGYANEDCDEGKWWLEGDLYCRQWKQWGYGETSKLLVSVNGNQINWWRPGSGWLVDSAILES